MSNETVLSALESARLEPPVLCECDCFVCDDGEHCHLDYCNVEFDAEPDWETLAEERDELREARWDRD